MIMRHNFVKSSKLELLSEIEKFYGQLYPTLDPGTGFTKDPRGKLTRY